MPESLRSRLIRWRLNFFPAYRRTGARLTYLADDWREVRAELPLDWRTRNYVGTIFGGSMYAAADPVYMLMLIRNLGSEYVVWTKASTIRFRRPGRSVLRMQFKLDQAEIDAIGAALEVAPSVDRVFRIDLVDAVGVVHATVEETIYIGRRYVERPNEAIEPAQGGSRPAQQERTG